MLSSPSLRARITVAAVGVLAAAVVLPAVPEAWAGRRVTITGGGWGHGIGMSQYGALGRAQKGQRAHRIVTHYYSNTAVRGADMPRRVRVGIGQARSAFTLTSSAFSDGGGRVAWFASGKRVAAGQPGVKWRVEPSRSGGMRLYKNGNRVVRGGRRVFGSPSRPLILRYARHSSIVSVTGESRYRHGRMEFSTYRSNCRPGFCLRLVVVVTMQHYLYGLGEVPSSWPRAALRAQVIAARTYALYKIRRYGQRREPCACAVYDSVFDQVYVGDSKRTGSGRYWRNWKGAVDATKRAVVLYRGAPIQAFYSSSSGGHTEDNENVWGDGTSRTAVPYLRGVRDAPDGNSSNPNHRWRVEMSWRAFSSKLNARFGTGRLQRFRIVKPRGVSKRVTVVQADGGGGVRLVGSNKTVRADGWDVRSALALKDTMFWVDVTRTVGTVFQADYRRLNGAPGEPTSPVYAVPRGWDEPLGRADRKSVV